MAWPMAVLGCDCASAEWQAAHVMGPAGGVAAYAMVASARQISKPRLTRAARIALPGQLDGDFPLAARVVGSA